MKIRPGHALWLIPLALIAIPGLRWLTSRETEAAAVTGVPVVVSQPELGDLEILLSYSGNLVAESTATVVAQLSGEVERIFVRENERVTAGQALALIDDEIVRIQSEQAYASWQAALAQMDKAVGGLRSEELESARATVTQSERDVEIAEANLERTRVLYAAGTVPAMEFEKAENQVRSAQTQLENARRSLSLMEQGSSSEDLAMVTASADAAEKTYELAMLQLRYATIQAPVSGTVAQILVEEGNSVGPGMPVLAIINDDLIYAHVAVPEKHYGDLAARAGTIPARVTPIALEGNPVFDGAVTTVAPIIDPLSRTFKVEIAIRNVGSVLRPGMFVNVDLIVEQVEDVLLVPGSAVVFRDDQTVVFVVELNSQPLARMIPVRTGVTQGNRIEIQSGVTPDMDLVVQGNAFLEDGQVVRQVNAQ